MMSDLIISNFCSLVKTAISTQQRINQLDEGISAKYAHGECFIIADIIAYSLTHQTISHSVCEFSHHSSFAPIHYAIEISDNVYIDAYGTSSLDVITARYGLTVDEVGISRFLIDDDSSSARRLQSIIDLTCQTTDGDQDKFFLSTLQLLRTFAIKPVKDSKSAKSTTLTVAPVVTAD